MNPVQALFQAILRKKTTGKETVPEGFCPNCWGKQEYGGRFYEAVKEHHVNLNEQDPQIGWIQDYYEKNLAHIQLRHPEKEDDSVVCQQCKLTYKAT